MLLADAMRSTILVSGRLNPTWAIKPGAITFHSFEGSLSFAHTLSRDKKMERFFCQQAETTTTTTITVWCVHKILLLHTPFTFVHCCWCRDRIKNAFVCWRILKKPQFYGFKALLLSLSFFRKAPHPFPAFCGEYWKQFFKFATFTVLCVGKHVKLSSWTSSLSLRLLFFLGCVLLYLSHFS